jgi:hypothetical protein
MRTLGNEERAARATCLRKSCSVCIAQRVCVPVPCCESSLLRTNHSTLQSVVVSCGEKANVCMCVLARGKTADANRVLSPSSLSLLLAQPEHCPLNKYYRTESAHAFFSARNIIRSK